ncbi:DNA primase large subunit Spp2 [Rhodotorula kratochvilovae]
MSGISFKISAPLRPTTSSAGSSSAPLSRPASSNAQRRPAPASRDSGRGGDSSDDDDEEGVAGARGHGARKRARLDDGEEVVEFGKDGARSKHARAPPAAPLVIPALPNKDWRLAAEDMRAARGAPRKKKALYLPDAGGGMSMSARAGAAGAAPVDEAMADRVNDKEVVGGLEQPVKRERPAPEAATALNAPAPAPAPVPQQQQQAQERAPLTDEQRALRELLGGAEGAEGDEPPEVDAIVSAPDARTGPPDEGDAFRQDVHSRPDQASLEDYARVPVGQFGLAMLRGMGWQPGQAASRSGRAGPTEAHVPSSRPALLGIGAKPMAEALGTDGGAKGKKGPGGSRREDMKFVPLVKQTLLALPSANSSRPSSRRPSRSPPPPSSRRDRDRDYDRDRGSSRRGEDDRSLSRRDRESSSRRDDRESSSRRDDRESSSRREGERTSRSYRDERESERSSSRRDDRREDRRDDRRERDRDSGRRF